MSPDFLRYYPTLMRFEGGYVHHELDPGGATNQGVTQRVYDAYRTKHGHPLRPVRQLEADEAHTIYAASYWTPAGCDALPWPLNAVVFDTAVHSGVTKARSLLTRTQDASIYLDLRELFLRRLVEEKPKLAVFKRGWLARIKALRALLTSSSTRPTV
jgi:lysozyme family protein